MKDILEAFVVGQAAMLKRNALLVGALAVASVVPAVVGVITKEPLFLSLGLSNAVIDLTVAYMLGSRILRRNSALEAAGRKVMPIKGVRKPEAPSVK